MCTVGDFPISCCNLFSNFTKALHQREKAGEWLLVNTNHAHSFIQSISTACFFQFQVAGGREELHPARVTGHHSITGPDSPCSSDYCIIVILSDNRNRNDYTGNLAVSIYTTTLTHRSPIKEHKEKENLLSSVAVKDAADWVELIEWLKFIIKLWEAEKSYYFKLKFITRKNSIQIILILQYPTKYWLRAL